MKYVRRAVPQGSFGSRQKRLYAKRKEAGVCTNCGANPVAVMEENTPYIILREGLAIVERGRPAKRCRECIEKKRQGQGKAS